MMALVYHGTPLTPRAALLAAGPRGYCVSYFRSDDVDAVEQQAPFVMYDNGAFSFWMQAVRLGIDPIEAGRGDWSGYYEWLEGRLFTPGRWAVIPDKPAAPSQLNDGLLNEWPFGRSRGAPVWHMDGPIDRLARLCERYDRICLGWIGDPKREPVGCDAYRRRMDEVAGLMGATWHPLHMLRGVLVGGDYPFVSCDSTSLAQNHHRYRQPLFAGTPDEWMGVRAYADKLERMAA
ncbi:hypothetical protein [Sphingomonas panaciterrae]|uniref:hypothetical protein n=1 Tax=Sphingomonas panaciterrae TaxID=1462999 RepID=UPI002FF02CE1